MRAANIRSIARLGARALVRSCGARAFAYVYAYALARSDCACALSVRLRAQFAQPLARSVCACALSLRLRAQFALARSSKIGLYGCRYLNLSDVLQANNVFLWNGSATDETAAATFFGKLLSAFIVDLEKRGGGRGGGSVNVFLFERNS